LLLARASGLYLSPEPGARVELDGTILRFDDTQPGWGADVVWKVSGRILKLMGAKDTPVGRTGLARALTLQVVSSRRNEPSPSRMRQSAK
jgi:hypothetical protein